MAHEEPLVNRLACVINADGTIARGFMIEPCGLRGENEYVITWKLPLQGEAKTNFSGTSAARWSGTSRRL
jgi:hypothetical protein